MKRFLWLLGGLIGIGCTRMATVQNPGTYIAAKQPRTVWLYKADHQVVRVNGPRLEGDTVVGSVNGQYTEVPLADVVSARAIVTDKGRTIALASVGGAATIAALVVVFSHTGNGSGLPPPVDTGGCSTC